METIKFITSNQGKIDSLRNILKNAGFSGFNIEMLSAEYPEDKSEGTLQHIALTGAKYCAEKYQEAVLVSDTGIFIDSLNGFPGINTAFALKTIGIEGLLALLKEKDNRSVSWNLSLGYCEPGRDPIEFTATAKGAIASEAKGEHGFGFDSIFIPEGKNITLAEEAGSALRDTITPFKEAILAFAAWHTEKMKK